LVGTSDGTAEGWKLGTRVVLGTAVLGGSVECDDGSKDGTTVGLRVGV